MRILPLIALLFAAPSGGSALDPSPEPVRELLRRQTQELLDAITSGSARVWDRYLDPIVIYTTEDGDVRTKAEMVRNTRPLPNGVSGTIVVADFKVALHGEVAVTTYLNDEHENYHGHQLHCQYRSTDTWRKTAQGWRLIASQVLAVRTDPPAVPLSSRELEEYAGRYQLTPAIFYDIRREGDRLVGQQTGKKAESLQAEAAGMLFAPGRPRYRMIFHRDTDGRITDFAERREAWDLVWVRSR